jgi:hypothetical protein
MIEHYIHYLIPISYLIVLLIGYLIGANIARNSSDIGVNNTRPKSFKQKNLAHDAPRISIDDTKYVTDINVSGLEKKYESLGETVKSEESITTAVDKLKNLKR